MTFWDSIEWDSAEDHDCKVEKLKTLPAPSYFTLCNVLYVCLSGPSLVIESTDSMIMSCIAKHCAC